MDLYITGVKGSGKTNRAVAVCLNLQKRLEAESPNEYQYYFCNLRHTPSHSLTNLGWKEVTIPSVHTHWDWLEDKSILLIDEIQDLYPSRSGTTKVPQFLQDFAKFRHRSIHTFYTSQFPSQVDKYLRDTITDYWHIEKPLVPRTPIEILLNKPERRIAHKWNRYLDPQRKDSYKDPNYQREKIHLDLNAFNYYESTVDNIEKREVPAIIKKLPLYLVVLGAVFYYGYNHFSARITPDSPSDGQTQTSPSKPTDISLNAVKSRFQDGFKRGDGSIQITYEDFKPAEYIPENSLYRTTTSNAQKYPFHVPEFGGCIKYSNDKCVCLDETARPLRDITFSQCIEFLNDPIHPYKLPKNESKSFQNDQFKTNKFSTGTNTKPVERNGKVSMINM